MDQVKEVSVWNKKRVFATSFILLALIIAGFFLKTKILDSKSSSPLNSLKSVKGTTSAKLENSQDKDFNIQEAVREKINSLKQEVSRLNIVEVASSSPQVQKIINDIKSLEQYPGNQAKEICKKVCGL